MAGKGQGYDSLVNEDDSGQEVSDKENLNVRFAGAAQNVSYQHQPQKPAGSVGAGRPLSYGSVEYHNHRQQQQQLHAVQQQPFSPAQLGSSHGPLVPGVVAVMPAPPAILGCPPGLEYLTQLDQLLVHQQVELAEVFLNIEFQNKYVIKNSLGQQVYFASEESDTCNRICCGNTRGFIMHITDNTGQEVIRVVRDFKCCAGCCWCADGEHCSLFVAVESPPGSVIGYVRQTQSCLSPEFDVLDGNERCVLKIRGHWCRCQTICCTDDIDFQLMTNDLLTQLGKVSKQWGGWVKESYTKADNFGVQFPMDLDVKMKAVILGSTFLIDFMFFEHEKKNKQNY